MTSITAYSLSEIDKKSISFGKPYKVGNFGYEIPVHLMKDNVKVPLLIKGANCWNLCFGIKRWEKKKDEKKAGKPSISIVVSPSTGMNEQQTTWLNQYKDIIVHACKVGVVDKKNEVNKPNISITSDMLNSPEFASLKDSNTGDVLLNLKLRQSGEAILTEFVDNKTDKDIPSKEMEGKQCSVNFDILISRIFVGTTIKMEVILDRAYVSGMKNPVIRREARERPAEDDTNLEEGRVLRCGKLNYDEKEEVSDEGK
jgi:hypothetical protein